MAKSDEKSDYVLRRIGGYVAAKVDQALQREFWIDDDGKKHYRRKAAYEPGVPSVPPTPSEPSVPTPSTPAPAPEGRFGRILHDYEFHPRKADGSFVSRPEFNEADESVKGLPETVKAADSVFVELSSAWQWFSFNLLWKGAPYLSRDEAINLFRKVYRSNGFKTNGKAPPKEYCNFVTGEGLGFPPMRTEVILTGGTMIEIMGEGRARGIDCWKYRTLNIHRAPPSLEIFDGVHQSALVYFATTSNRAKNGALVISLTGGPDVAIPSVSDKDWALVDKRRVVLLPDGSPAPEPYNR